MRTTNDDITLSNYEGVVSSTNGDLDLRECNGVFSTTNGDIYLYECKGSVSTTNGEIHIGNCELDEIETKLLGYLKALQSKLKLEKKGSE